VIALATLVGAQRCAPELAGGELLDLEQGQAGSAPDAGDSENGSVEAPKMGA
jgi:hypothetical protein